MSALEVKVPPIGDFKDVPVIEVLVKPGDAVAEGDGLVTLESEKATLDVPAPAAGTVKELRVAIGDRLSEGSVVLLLETAAGAPKAPAPAPAPAPAESSAESPYYASRADIKVHSAPSSGSRVLATLSLHQKVLRSDVQHGYARIRTPDGRIQGWVDNGLLIWRLPASQPSDTGTGAVESAPQPAPPASPAEPAAPVKTAPPAPAEAPPPARKVDGAPARPGAEVFDRF